MPQVVYTNREIIIGSFVVLACFLLSYFFPTQGIYQDLISFAAFLVLIPLLYLKFILKRPLSDFGVSRGNWKKGILGGALSLVLSGMLVYILLNYTDFLQTQNFLLAFRNNFGQFIFYEFFFVGTLVAVFEFFFRGFVLKSLLGRFGAWGVVIQFALFGVYALITQGFNLGMAYFLIVAFFSGGIVYWSHSILYSIIYGWIFILIADAVVIRLS